MASKHRFDLKKQGKKILCPGGSRVLLTSSNMKSLHGMAIAILTLKLKAIREPHWHPNSSELAYCIAGKALVTMFSPENRKDTFTLSEGEVAYFPKGYLHHIENTSSKESKFILVYDHDKPEDLDLSASIESMSRHVLSSTFSGKEKLFDKMKKYGKDTFISTRKTAATLKAPTTNPNKFNLERINPQIDSPGGNAKTLTRNVFPKLNTLALFSLRVYKNGIREPHWHPNSTELNYVISGKAKVTILSPDGKLDKMDLSPGEGSVIPAGYFHSIENIGNGELRMAVYFNNALPDDIGLSGALSAYSKETIASLFSINPRILNGLHKYAESRMIVSGGA